jgi:NADPH:quinone reductase-like Zn-dependent oxidoreductase
MRAIVIEKFGGPDSLVYQELPEPEPKAGHVVIAIKAFGINHAEMHMRRGEWAEAAKVSGIECVGLVKSCPGGEFPIGAKVAALMGGLGRTINGSYAEYTRAPVSSHYTQPRPLRHAEEQGAERVELEGPDLSKRIAEVKQLDAVLDLVGNSTILDSLAMLRRGGRACLAGWLGGLAPIADFNPLLQMASGVYLTSSAASCSELPVPPV